VVTIDSLEVIRKAQITNSISQKMHKPPVLNYDWLVTANMGNASINQEQVTLFVSRSWQNTSK
jgi:hypothetical protein